ncbi:MAG: hypothetical protein JXA71_00500 [Chitinispirillaceae bacterium]|nr:hypothetical protein [Chitinispirillaceae bacterium]
MTFFSALLAVLFCLVAGLSVWRIAVMPLAARYRSLLITIRITLVALLAVAFFEPAIVLDRLSSPLRPVPVLIDASKSMRAFSHDPVITSCLSALNRWNALQGNGKKRFLFFAFGDSLRPLRPGASPEWSDRRSLFPESWKDKEIRASSSMIIVSDGNWSNASHPAAFFTDKNIWYVPLTTAREFPWLRIDLPHFPGESVADSPLVATAVIEGSSTGSCAITVTAREINRVLSTVAIDVGGGYFKKEVALRLGARAAGAHLYRFDATASRDTLADSRYALHTAVPSRFSYALADDQPSLDRRFIRLALQRRADFAHAPAAYKSLLDLLVVTKRAPSADRLTKTLKRRGVLLFFGCLPCSSAASAPDATLRLFASDPSPFSDIDLSMLPPPSRLASCINPSLRPRPSNIMLAALQKKEKGIDTTALVYTGRFSSLTSVVCAVDGVWKWDFFPPGMQSDEDRAFFFSDRLLDATRDVITAGLSSNLLVFPTARCVASDSLSFRVAFPAAIPAGSRAGISFTMTGERGRLFDTSFILEVTGSSRLGFLTRPPERPGVYRVEIVADAGGETFTFTDTLQVGEDRSEYLTSRQNAQLLSEFALPIDDFDDASLAERFFSDHAGVNRPVRETIHLGRGWLLLVLLFLALAAEWGLRRLLRLD